MAKINAGKLLADLRWGRATIKDRKLAGKKMLEGKRLKLEKLIAQVNGNKRTTPSSAEKTI